MTSPRSPRRRAARLLTGVAIPKPTSRLPHEGPEDPAYGPAKILAARQALEEAAAAMDGTLRRGGTSAGIARSAHTAVGFHGPTGTLVVGGRDSHPLLLEAAGEALAALVARQAAEGRPFAAEEIYWTNDPRCGAAGVEDLILAAPILAAGRLAGFVAVSAAHAGLGRATLAPSAGLRREGIILPWVRAAEAGRLQPGLCEIAAANAEDPAAFLEDLTVQSTALAFGLDAVEEVLELEGGGVLAAMAEAGMRGWRRALDRLLHRPDSALLEGRLGPFAVEIRADGPEAPVAVSVRTDGGHGELTAALARAAVRAAMRQVLAAEVPGGSILGGASEALAIATPWDAAPSAVTTGAGRFAEAQLLQDALLTAFAEKLPHLTHAADAAPALLDLRGEWGDGRRYRLRLGLGAGAGASVFGDGLSHGASAFFPLRLDAVEAVERAAPIRIARFQLTPDSGGPGQYRGGLGARLEFELLEGRAVADVLLPGRAMGLRGGLRGAEARLTRVSEEDGTREDLGPAQLSLRLKPGDRVLLESPGGGGWGVPYQRSIMRLEEDLRAGLVSPAQSRNRYSLVLKPDSLEKDDHLTYRVRHYLLTTLTAEDLIAGEQLLDD